MAQTTMQKHNQSVLDDLEEGDLIQIDRGMYSHWAVYAGDEDVIHLTGIGGTITSDQSHAFTISGVLFDKAIVKVEQFWKVVGNSKANKNNSKDKTYRSLAPYDIVQRALTRRGPLAYNILCNNCEHFASWCRYDSEISHQADNIIIASLTAGAFAVAGFWIANRNLFTEKKRNTNTKLEGR